MVGKLGLAALLLTVSGASFASQHACRHHGFLSFDHWFDHGSDNDHRGSDNDHRGSDDDRCRDEHHPHEPGTASAPEIDPASAMVGLTLTLGGLAVLRGRRARKTA